MRLMFVLLAALNIWFSTCHRNSKPTSWVFILLINQPLHCSLLLLTGSGPWVYYLLNHDVHGWIVASPRFAWKYFFRRWTLSVSVHCSENSQLEILTAEGLLGSPDYEFIMITPKVLNFLKQSVECYDFWRCARWSYGGSTGNFINVQKSRLRKFLSALEFCLHVSYAIFMLVQFLQYTYLDEGADGKLKVFVQYFFAVHLVPNFCCHSLFFLREETTATFFNQFISYHSSIKKGSTL